MDVRVAVFVESESGWICAVLVSVELHDEEESTDEYEGGIRSVAESGEGFGAAPCGKGEENRCEGGYLTCFHTDVKGNDFSQKRHAFAYGDLLEAGRESEAVDESEYEYCGDQVGGFHVEVFSEAVYVVEAFVTDGECDNGIYEEVVGLDPEEGGADECDAVSECEGCNELDDIFEFGEEEYDAEEEEEMVISGEHMCCAKWKKVQESTFGCADLISFGHSVGENSWTKK